MREQVQVLSIPALIGIVASVFAGTLPLFFLGAGVSLAWLAFIWACYWIVAFWSLPID